MARFMSKARGLTVIVWPALYTLDGQGQRMISQQAHEIAFKNGYYETDDPAEIAAIMKASQTGETIVQVDVEAPQEEHHTTQMVTGASSAAPSKPVGGNPDLSATEKGQLDKAMEILDSQASRIDELNVALGKAIEAIKSKDESIAILKEGVAKLKPVTVYHCKECNKAHRSIAAARWCCKEKK